MKVIKSRVAAQSDAPKRCVCEECESELEYSKEDMHVGYMGVMYVTCPVCDEEILVGAERKLSPTWPITFQQHTSETCTTPNCVVNQLIDKVICELQASTEERDVLWMSQGGTMVLGCKNTEGIEICVTQDYWDDFLLPNE